MSVGSRKRRSQVRLTAVIGLAHGSLAAAKLAGLDPATVAQVAQYPAEALEDPDARIEFASVERAWAYIERECADPSIGIHAAVRVAAVGGKHLVTHAARHSATFGEACSLYERYGSIVNEAVEIRMKETPQGAIFRSNPVAGLPRWPRAYTQFVLTFM